MPVIESGMGRKSLYQQNLYLKPVKTMKSQQTNMTSVLSRNTAQTHTKSHWGCGIEKGLDQDSSLIAFTLSSEQQLDVLYLNFWKRNVHTCQAIWHTNQLRSVAPFTVLPFPSWLRCPVIRSFSKGVVPCKADIR